MRCYICDFSDGEAKSAFHTSVVDPKGAPKRKVMYDRTRDVEVCTVCEAVYYGNLFSLENKGKKRLEDNAPAVPLRQVE